jgi:hypothetical protein
VGLCYYWKFASGRTLLQSLGFGGKRNKPVFDLPPIIERLKNLRFDLPHGVLFPSEILGSLKKQLFSFNISILLDNQLGIIRCSTFSFNFF